MLQKRQINFSKYSSIRIGQVVDVSIIEDCNFDFKNYHTIGSCNNILLGNNPPPLAILSKKFDYIKIKKDKIYIGGATPSGKIVSFCKKHNLANFEYMAHLPGKLGGLVYMNAGLKEFEIFNYLQEIKTCSGILKKKDIDFGYRYTNINSPILEAVFDVFVGFDEQKLKMFKEMRSNQPKTPSAGSCFKNPKGDYAGRLIEEVGLKGFKLGDMEFSKEHANFLVNHGGGTYKDALFLIDEAKKRVLEKFNILLECEICILDSTFKDTSSKFS